MYSFILKSKIVNRFYNDQLQNELILHGLSLREWGIILYLFEVSSATFSDVASYWQVEKPSVTPAAQKLVEKGFVYISPGRDKRKKVMLLSEKGVKMYEQIKPIVDLYQKELMDGISQEEREIAEQLLDKLLENLMKRG